MNNEIWGIKWVRDLPDTQNSPSWYESKDEAVAEFNSRDDKYWASQLFVGRVTDVTPVHCIPIYAKPPWERDYEGHYYQEEA